MKSPIDSLPRISRLINAILSVKSCMYGLPPCPPIDIGSTGRLKSTLCIRAMMVEASRLKAVSSGVVMRVYVVCRFLGGQPFDCVARAPGVSTHRDGRSQDIPDLAGELCLDECQVVPAVIQAAGELGIDILRSRGLRAN